VTCCNRKRIYFCANDRGGNVIPFVGLSILCRDAISALGLQALRQLGWTDGGNSRIDVRWPGSDLERARKYASELVALAPDVLLASTSPMVTTLQQATRNVPIVFVAVIDPVGAGMVASLARPGGNVTGFIL
jgi:putative tryptophan/tyrosine transport system substrate-binding protein